MSKLIGLSAMKSLDQFKSLPGAAKNFSIASRPASNLPSSGSFANLKLTAEKLVKEQASAKTDLDLANSKLKKLTDHIRVLEEKLQNAFNENAKLKVKQKEDEKLWRGLESKFSSTKTLCDQLMETLQMLAAQVQDAENDKVFFTNKLSETSIALENLHDQMKSLTLRLESSEETVRNRETELKELGIGKEDLERQFQVERQRVVSLMHDKDNLMKRFEVTVEANESTVASLNSQLKELRLELRSKEDILKILQESKESTEKENVDLVSSNAKFAEELDATLRLIKNLEDFVNLLTETLTELDKQSLVYSQKVVQMTTLFDTCFKLMHEEKNLVTRYAQQRFNQLHDQFRHARSENDALQLVNHDMENKISQLQEKQEFTIVQHAEESRLSEERVRSLESEVGSLLSKKTELEFMVSTLEEKIGSLSEANRSSEKTMQDFQLKFSELEVCNKDSIRSLQSEIQRKEEEIDILQKEIAKHKQDLDSLEKQVNELHSIIEEKEKMVLECKDKEKQLEVQNMEILKLLDEAERNVTQAKNQYDQMLESKQLELSRHLKEISQRNDQAVNDIRRKYEVEKLECINLEKEKAEKLVVEIEKKCDQKLAECQEMSKKHLLHIQSEHATVVSRIQQEHDKKELDLISNHQRELQNVKLQAENDLKDKTMLLKNQHEAEIRDLRLQHEDECKHLEEELTIQKSKEERQRALLQLQWKVMGEEPQEEQEVTSKKNFYMSSNKLRNSDNGTRSQHTLGKGEDREKDFPYLKSTQSPMTNLLKKVEKVNTENIISIPKHGKKVTHREYQVETSGGRTITKRRKTKSTIMFEDPRKHNNKRQTPKVKTPGYIAKGTKREGHQNVSNIGDLFTEGSLNPYADDPYAFD